MSESSSKSAAVTTPGPFFSRYSVFGPSPCKLEGDLLEVENDVGHVLDDAGEG